jgi:tetratricopeptide (TPR) repeat protein
MKKKSDPRSYVAVKRYFRDFMRTACAGIVLSCASMAYANSSEFDISIDKDAENDLNALPAALVRGAEEAYTINKQGLDFLDKNELDSAMARFSKASGLLPIYSDAENNKAVVHFRRGNVSIAKMIWESVLAKDPGYAVAQYNIGIVDFYDNSFEPARESFQKALKINKKFTEALVMMGRTELHLDKKRQACDYFKEAMKIDGNSQDIWEYCAFGLISAGDTASAQAILLKKKPKPEALKMLGQIEAARGNYAAASTYLAQAVNGGALPQLLIDLASMQMDARKYKDALATVKAYEKKVPAMSADAFCIAGISAKEGGDMDAARSYFEKGIKQFPQDPVLRFNLGQIYFLQKKFSQAENAWQSLSDTTSDPSLCYMKALSAKQRGEFGVARQFVEKAIKLDERAEFVDLLGVLFYSQGKKDEATVQFKKALSLDPGLRSAQLNLALMTQSKDGLESAVAETEKRRSACVSECQDITLQLAILLYHLGKTEKAAAFLDGLPDDQKDLKIVRHAALFYSQLRDWEKSIKILEKAKTAFVFDTKTEYELAEDYLLAGHYAKAIDALKSILGKWEENPWRLYYQLGYACMELNDLDKAKSFFQQSLKSKPDNIASQGVLALIYSREGKTQEARTLWEKNLGSDPSNPTLHINLGLSLEKEGRFQEALDHYTKARALTPGDDAVMVNVGTVYESMNRNADALNAYKQALKSSKKNLAAYNIFLLSQKSGNEAAAKEMLSLLRSEFPASIYTKRAEAENCFRDGDTAKGIKALESLPEKDPVDWYMLARVYALRNDFKKSESCIDKLPKEPLWEKARTDIAVQRAFAAKDFGQAYTLLESLHDTSFSAQYNLAIAAFEAKKFGEAVAIGEAIVQKAKGKDRSDVCRVVGNANFGLKQWKKARQWYEQLAGMERNDAVVQYNCAVASYNLGDMEPAWEYYQKARELNPALTNKDIENRYSSLHAPAKDSVIIDSTDILYNNAVALQNDTKNDSAAELIYKKILEKKGSYYRAWNNLGTIYSARGELKDALDCFLRSIEKQHDIPEAYANLVNIYVAMDSLGAAQRWIFKGLAHNPDSEMLKQLDAQVKNASVKGKKKRK